MPFPHETAEKQPSTYPTQPTSGGHPAAIDRGIPIPYYYQLETLLRAEIDAGRYPPGSPILSERLLCEAYGVSRTTVRQAIARLVSDGLLYHLKGKGTFVVPPPSG
jgi:GntR family transcriptional regulator